MKKLITFLSVLFLFMTMVIAFAHHSNEKYCFDCMHKYKIGDKKNDTYEFEFDLENTIFVNYKDSIGRTGTIDLEKKVEKQISDKEVDLIELLIEIWSKKIKILLITVICVIVGGAISFLNDDRL